MSSQENQGIPLLHAPDGTGYKLLELPPELLELLESQDPPTHRGYQSLTLHPSPTAALLKTPAGKTYSLRQKNTSNALILLEPTTTTTTTTTTTGTGTGTGPADGSSDPSQSEAAAAAASSPPSTTTGLRAIATLHETIELMPEADGGGSQAATAAAAAAKPRGKWHEKFARRR
ncbi:hypothetical protein VTJ49DRAFT_3220 [Mycothermus thermophilus]|uniref:Sister chromatid cohesion protein DCC1 n=1 Tax=Humicola insolens TaxID=85995 RepID=A0ABR3VNT2_HUMIN